MFLGQIWGNLLSSVVLKADDDTSNKTDNATLLDLSTCGANFCPSSDENNTNLDKPDFQKVAHEHIIIESN